MENSYEQLLSLGTEPTSQADLFENIRQKVIKKIDSREKTRLFGHCLGFGIVIISVVITFVSAVKYFMHTATISGLGQYVSLIASDGSYALSHWQNLSLSIIDILPTTTIMALISLLIVGFVTLQWFLKYQDSFKFYRHHALSVNS